MLTIATRVHDYGRSTPEMLFERIAEDGFEGVMLAFQKAITGVSSYYDVTPDHIVRVKNALWNNGLALETLGVYMELGLAVESERQKAVNQFLVGMRVAKDMGLSQVASESTPMQKQPLGTTWKEAYRCLIRSMEEILPTAQDLGIEVCLEPVYYHVLSSSRLAKKLIDDLQSPNLKITLDPANLLDVPQFDNQYAVWDEAFDLLGDLIRLVHMKGIRAVDGKRKKAPRFSKSILDYPYLFKKIKQLERPLHIIREETNPVTAAADVAYLKSLC
ncbi:MAG: sugar phosphate isomerase/epimerase family protein [Candidatus Fimivivens sp.]|nr:sugar phosphate isomerase/epimerase family protein [Candidatus Fimivivens sp.]